MQIRRLLRYDFSPVIVGGERDVPLLPLVPRLFCNPRWQNWVAKEPKLTSHGLSLCPDAPR